MAFICLSSKACLNVFRARRTAFLVFISLLVVGIDLKIVVLLMRVTCRHFHSACNSGSRKNKGSSDASVSGAYSSWLFIVHFSLRRQKGTTEASIPYSGQEAHLSVIRFIALSPLLAVYNILNVDMVLSAVLKQQTIGLLIVWFAGFPFISTAPFKLIWVILL